MGARRKTLHPVTHPNGSIALLGDTTCSSLLPRLLCRALTVDTLLHPVTCALPFLSPPPVTNSLSPLNVLCFSSVTSSHTLPKRLSCLQAWCSGGWHPSP